MQEIEEFLEALGAWARQQRENVLVPKLFRKYAEKMEQASALSVETTAAIAKEKPIAVTLADVKASVIAYVEQYKTKAEEINEPK
jgi:hypothetical protein